MRYRVLIIGCGNIGALYDLNSQNKIWTHAKAFASDPQADMYVTDTNTSLAKKIAVKYKATPLDLKTISKHNFDIVCITTPTPTHVLYLKEFLKNNTPVIICEKPVASKISDIKILEKLYTKSNSKILVNYIRRFQPAYQKLKTQLHSKKEFANCKGILIKYQRGFLNNAGHAFDLLSFLFDKPLEFKNFKSSKLVFDAFDYDPTITGSFLFKNIAVTVSGITEIKYPVFEIELFFESDKIVICHSGNDIRFYKIDASAKVLKEVTNQRVEGILEKYMLPIREAAKSLLTKKANIDNFKSAADLNTRIIKIINREIKKF